MFNNFFEIAASTTTRNAAVVGKRTTTVYAEGDRKPLFKCVSHWQNMSRSTNYQRLWWLPDVCYPAKYERSRSSHRRLGTRKPKSRLRRFDLFACHLPPKTIPSYLTVHDNLAVTATVSEIWAFKIWSFFFECAS